MNWQGKRVLVTGCSGVIGRHLLKYLLDQQAVVRGIDMNPCGLMQEKSFDFLQKDLLHLNPINVLSFEPEIVFHLAAAFERSEENVEFWQNNYMNNLLVSHQVIDMLRYSQSVKKFIFASSYLVYDCALYSSSKKAVDPVYLKETAQKNPRNLTGAAKYYAEKEIEFFHTNLSRDLQYINARIYRSYGEDSKDIISRWVRLALKGEELSLYGRNNSFDYIYAKDVALGLIKLAETDFIGSVNLGSGKSVPVAHVIDTLKRSFSKLKVKETKNSVHFENSGAEMSLFKQLTKWMPAHDLNQGISRIITHEKSKQ